MRNNQPNVTQGGRAPNQGGGGAPAPPAPNATVPPVNGGLTATGQAWTGGSRDPALQALVTGPRTPMCICSDNLNHHVWSRCEKGIDEEWRIKLNDTLPLSTCELIIHDGLKDIGVDSVF